MLMQLLTGIANQLDAMRLQNFFGGTHNSASYLGHQSRKLLTARQDYQQAA